MKVVVLGAGGGVGRCVVRAAVARGDEVVAAARTRTSVPEGVEYRMLDVRDAEAVDEVLVGADAVVWCVGVTKKSGPDVGRVAMPEVIASAARQGVKRIVGVSGAGVTLPGDVKGRGARFVSGLTHRFARDLVDDKYGEYEALASSSMSWTQVRPPRLSDGPATGRWVLTTQAPGLNAAAVSRADLAQAMLLLTNDDQWASQAPFIVTPR